MASAPRFSGGRYKTFEARKAVVEKMITVLGGLLKSIQINLACVFENGTRTRERPMAMEAQSAD
jgi:hypothetical protein